ncbi:MAG: two-component system sensor histidine kinase QseC [Psychrosphaera sp.]|jgi:two-component system sensor histidine kinase QseC
MISIKRYQVLMITSIITLVCFTAAIQGYRASMKKADLMFDQELVSMAKFMLSFSAGKERTKVEGNENFAFQYWQANKLIFSSNNSPTQPLADFKAGISQANFAGKRWQIYSQYNPNDDIWVFTAHPSQRRVELAEVMTLSAITPLILSIPFLALLIYFTVNQSLKPLISLSSALKLKKENDFDVLHIKNKSKELKPVINTLNQLLVRLNSAFIREKRFASDAAHELRTPLSVLKLNLFNIVNELKDVESGESLSQLQHGVNRMTHVIEQILLLNRTSPESFQANFKQLDLDLICKNVIKDIYPDVLAKKQTIEYFGSSETVMCDEFSISTLLQNLIGNAIKYTEEHSIIKVSLFKSGHNVVLQVDDSGEGIPSTEYARVFDRFYRVGGDQHQTNTIGCGLGLAIVQHIVELHGATISLSQSQSLGGLSVTVKFHQYD